MVICFPFKHIGFEYKQCHRYKQCKKSLVDKQYKSDKELELELKSYRKDEPWRELQETEEKPDPPRDVIET